MTLQERVPFDLSTSRPLPNIGPVAMSDWLLVDEAYAGQMATR